MEAMEEKGELNWEKACILSHEEKRRGALEQNKGESTEEARKEEG